MNKLVVAGAIIGATVFVGCMSLEERLASNDANVRRQAEYELVQRAYRSGTQADRLAAIAKVSDQDLLFGLAMKSQEDTAKEGASAVQKLTDANRTLQVAKECAVAEVSTAALSKIADSNAYADIVQRAKAPAVRSGAYEKITDQNQLLSIAQTTKDKAIKLSAIKRVNDKEKLLPIVFASTATTRPAAQPAKHNPDNEKRMMAEKMNMEKKMMADKMAMEKKMGGGKKSTASKPNASITTVAVDSELVDAFIANCSQDAVLIKMVKHHGAKLSASQCAALTKKSTNAELKELIASVADLKIAEQIRHATPDEYKGLLDSISNTKIKNSACAEILLKGLKISDDGDGYSAAEKHGIANVQFAKGLTSRGDSTMKDYLEYLSESQITDIVVNGNLDGNDLYALSSGSAYSFRVAVLKSVTLDQLVVMVPKIIECYKQVEDKSSKLRERHRGIKDEFQFRIIKEMPSDQAKLIAIIKASSGFALQEDFIRAMSREIASSNAAEEFLSYASDYVLKNDVTMYPRKDIFPILAGVMLKVGNGEKNRVLSEAKNDLSAHQKDVCIGPFYLGMSYYAATIMADSEGLYSKKKDEITLYFDNENPKEIMKDWKHNLKVKKIAFSTKAALKYLDCEDAMVLQQAIKQCVKKERGKADAFDYASEIKHNVKVDSSTRINLFSPTGTSTDYESEIWASYTNTRLGIKLSYGEKSGTLILENL